MPSPGLQRNRRDPSRRPCGPHRPPLAAPQGAPLGRHPAAEASARAAARNMSCIEANVLLDTVQGCTDSWTNAPFAVPSIAGDGEEGPKARAHDARASAAVHGCTVSRPRRRREAQGILPRTMRCKTPRWALDLFGYFLGHCAAGAARTAKLAPKGRRAGCPQSCQKQPALPQGERKLCTPREEKRRITMDSRLRGNDEMKKQDRLKRK